ncbi:MAG: radical SAM protein [Clostridia bacterium]|nr:radical SAM protein [Clostridia bacterium]
MKRNAQSLSICVPGKRCINQCKFCVSCMHADAYKNQMDENLPFYDLYFEDYVKRMIFAKENDANIMMITGDIEPLQNRHFLQTLAMINKYVLPQRGCSAFNWIEVQTSAVGFDRNCARFLRNTVGVSVLSLSLSSFDNEVNAEIVGMPKNMKVNISEVCAVAKEYDFTLRLSLNMSEKMLLSIGEGWYPTLVPTIFSKAKELGADQITFRKFYTSGNNEQSRWIKQNAVPDGFFKVLHQYVKAEGRLIGTLPYGYNQYSVNGISTVIDEDCMNESKTEKEASKYFVIRPDCKLYDGWNKEDIIF